MTGRQHDIELPEGFANDGPAAQDWKSDPISRFIAGLPVWVVVTGIAAAATLPTAIILTLRTAGVIG